MPENLPTPGLFVDAALKTLFNDSIDQLIADIGRPLVLHFPPSVSGCPNCFAAPDGNSNGIYDSANTFVAGEQFHRPFPNGTKCPVCRGDHKIKLGSTTTTYIALRQWAPKDIDATVYGTTPENVVRTKIQIVGQDDLKRATKAVIDGHIVVRITDPVPAGLSPPNYAKVFWKKQD